MTHTLFLAFLFFSSPEPVPATQQCDGPIFTKEDARKVLEMDAALKECAAKLRQEQIEKERAEAKIAGNHDFDRPTFIQQASYYALAVLTGLLVGLLI